MNAKSFLKFIIYSNLWVALAATSWCSFGMMLFDQFQWEWSLLVFCATFCAYHFQRFYLFTPSKQEEIALQRNQWYQKNSALLHGLSVLLGLSAVYCFFELQLHWTLFIPPVLLVFFYKAPLPIINKNLRALPYLKIIIITIVWTYVLAYTWMHGKELELKHIIFIFQTALIVASTSLPFDYRDQDSDRGTLKSLPMLLGDKGSILFSLLSYLIMGILTVFFFNPHWGFYLFFIISSLLYYWSLKKMTQKPGDDYYAWVFDGFILWNGLFSVLFLVI